MHLTISYICNKYPLTYDSHMHMNIKLKMMQDTVQCGFKNPYFIGLLVHDKLLIIVITSTS